MLSHVEKLIWHIEAFCEAPADTVVPMITVTGAVMSLHTDRMWNSRPSGAVRTFWS